MRALGWPEWEVRAAPQRDDMPVVTMREMLDSGVHFGLGQTRRWKPQMKRFILTERNGIYIIDLQQSSPSSTRHTRLLSRPSHTVATSCSWVPRDAGSGSYR